VDGSEPTSKKKGRSNKQEEKEGTEGFGFLVEGKPILLFLFREGSEEGRWSLGMQSSDVERVLRNLAVIASLSANDKLMTENDHFSVQSPTSLLGWMQRKWMKESRDVNLNRVALTMRAAKAFIGDSYKQRGDELSHMGRRVGGDLVWMEHVQTCRRMKEVLLKSLSGMRQQRSTYKDDALHVAKIDTLLNEMEDFFVALSFMQGKKEGVGEQEEEEERRGRMAILETRN